MSGTAELLSIPRAEDSNYSDYHYGLAYSALPDNPYPDSAEPTPHKDVLNDPAQFVDEITGSHDFKEIVTKFHEKDDLLKSDPHLRLVIWEQVVDQLPPLEPADLAESTGIILDSLEDVRKDPNSANMVTLMAVAQSARYLDSTNQQVVIETLDGILHNAQNADDKYGVRIEPNLAHAAEEVIEAAKDGRIDSGEIDAELLRHADLKAAEALNKAIRRKNRIDIFKKIVTGKILKRAKTTTVSEAELDEIANRQMDEMIERERSYNAIIATQTGPLPVQEMAAVAEKWKDESAPSVRPRTVRRMSLEELEAADDTGEIEVANVDSFIESQLRKTSDSSESKSRAA